MIFLFLELVRFKELTCLPGNVADYIFQQNSLPFHILYLIGNSVINTHKNTEHIRNHALKLTNSIDNQLCWSSKRRNVFLFCFLLWSFIACIALTYLSMYLSVMFVILASIFKSFFETIIQR